MIYSADYSNAEAMSRDIHANLWHGEATSNTVTLQLQPPDAQGTIEGTVFGSSGRAYGGVLVTLSDDNENPIDQLYADDNGKFTFAHLPAGRYWLTVRDPGTEDDTSVFRHLDLDQGGAPATPEIMMLPSSRASPTTARTLLVPTSRTTMGGTLMGCPSGTGPGSPSRRVS